MELRNRKHPKLHKVLCIFLPERCPYCDKIINSDKLFCDKCKNIFGTVTYKTYAKGGFPCVSATTYANEFAAAVKRFKFYNRRQYAFSLARTLAEAVIKEYQDVKFDCIAYVPMHRIKQQKRGYNHSHLLAKELSFILNIPLGNILVKVKNNEPQHKTEGAAKRAENVKGAFKAVSAENIKDKNILLIDDIITTGHTLGECARMLMKHNPREIRCATFSVTVSKTS